jgi:hypothetical protein
MNWLEALIEITKDRRTPFQKWRDRIFLGIFTLAFFGTFFYGLYSLVALLLEHIWYA